MKFKCTLSGCIYTFESALDIKAMRLSRDYVEVPDGPATVVPATPVVPPPNKPASPAAKASGAV